MWLVRKLALRKPVSVLGLILKRGLDFITELNVFYSLEKDFKGPSIDLVNLTTAMSPMSRSSVSPGIRVDEIL